MSSFEYALFLFLTTSTMTAFMLLAIIRENNIAKQRTHH